MIFSDFGESKIINFLNCTYKILNSELDYIVTLKAKHIKYYHWQWSQKQSPTKSVSYSTLQKL